MTLIWQQITLNNFSLNQWQKNSYLAQWFCGSLTQWRESSWLMQWGEPISFILIALVFSLAPFIGNTLMGILLLASVAFWVLLTLTDSTGTGLTPIHLLVLLYWGIATIATAMSPVKLAAFMGWQKLTLYLLFFAGIARIIRHPQFRSWLIAIYLNIALIVSFYGIRQWIDKVPPLATWNDPTSTQANLTRAYSFLGNPNVLGSYLLPAIALSIAAIFIWKTRATKALAVTMLITNLACLRFTDSRGAWIGFVGLIVTFLILIWLFWSPKMPKFWRNWGLYFTLGGLGTVLILGILFIPPLRERVLSIFMGRGDSSNNFRINVWSSVINMIKDYPILGIGPGNTAFNKIYPLYMKPRFTALSAYSILLEITVETGLIGLGAFLWLLLVTFYQGIHQLKRLRNTFNPEVFWLIAATSTLVGMLAHGLFDTVWYRPDINVLWWFMVAIIASYFVPPETQNSQEQHPTPENF